MTSQSSLLHVVETEN